jgi:hypothetical protein
VQDYASYAKFYEAVIASRLLQQQGDTFGVLLRFREGGGGITAVLDVRSTVTYTRPGPNTVVALSVSQEIREVENAGSARERLLPQGRDSGYLWRANTFTYLREEAGGVYVEMETFGLSREFPPLLGWLIEPIAKGLICGRTPLLSTTIPFLLAGATTWLRIDGRTRLRLVCVEA